MAFIQWSDKYSLGIESIDQQHKKLVSMINAINKAIADGETELILARIFSELAEYTRLHFSYEEKLFSLHGYPDTHAHKQQHSKLIKQVFEMKEKFEIDPASIAALELVQFLRSWLLNHIMNTDKDYACFLIAKGVK